MSFLAIPARMLKTCPLMAAGSFEDRSHMSYRSTYESEDLNSSAKRKQYCSDRPSSSGLNHTSVTSARHAGQKRPSDLQARPKQRQIGDWSEHISSSGKRYYYNIKSEVSQWEKPPEWLEFEQKQNRRSQDDGSYSNSSSRSGSNLRPEAAAVSHASSQHKRSTVNNSNNHRLSDRSQNSAAGSASSFSVAAARRPVGGSDRRDRDRPPIDHRSRGNGDNNPRDSSCDNNQSSSPVVVGSRVPNGIGPSKRSVSSRDYDSGGGGAGQQQQQRAKRPRVDERRKDSPVPSCSTETEGENFLEDVDLDRLPHLLVELAEKHNINLQRPDAVEKLKFYLKNALTQPESAVSSGNSPQTITNKSPMTKLDVTSPLMVASTRMTRIVDDRPIDVKVDNAIPRVEGNAVTQQSGSLNGSLQHNPMVSLVTTTTQRGLHYQSDAPESQQDASGRAMEMAGSAAVARRQPSPLPPARELSLQHRHYIDSQLVQHVLGWPADTFERQARLVREEGSIRGAQKLSQISADLKCARSLVRVAEIKATLLEQRVMFLRQQNSQIDGMRSSSLADQNG